MPSPTTDIDPVKRGDAERTWRLVVQMWLWGIYIAFGGIATFFISVSFPFNSYYYIPPEDTMGNPAPGFHWYLIAINFVIIGAFVYGIPFAIRWFRLRGHKRDQRST